MRKLFFLFLSVLFSLSVAAQWTRNKVFTITGTYDDSTTPEAGLEKIVVFKTMAGATISYEAESGNSVNIYTYQNSIADKTPITFTTTPMGGKTLYTVSNLLDDRGLLVEDNNKMTALWMIDYSLHQPHLQSIEAIEADDRCEVLKLLVVNNSDDLQYRGVSGQVRNIRREFDLAYRNIVWSDANFAMEEKDITLSNVLSGTEILLSGNDLPYMNTEFTLSGDQFGKKFNMSSSITSTKYEAVAVMAHLQAVQAPKDAENEGHDGKELGGSAPVDIDFYGYGNNPVAYFYTWFIYDKNNMNNPIARYTDVDFSYTFEQYGNYEVVLEVANAESTCVTTESVSFEIFESDLDIPNFFSPGSSPGSNDEFKVYYKSLIKYHITIFNRWGNKVWESRDPSQGWDGRYGGRLVNPGVYFYSIQATGSDGRKWNKGGDINILR